MVWTGNFMTENLIYDYLFLQLTIVNSTIFIMTSFKVQCNFYNLLALAPLRTFDTYKIRRCLEYYIARSS